MVIEKTTFSKSQYILKIQKKEYLVDEYVYKLILPYDGKIIDKKQFEIIVAFSLANNILKNLYKKIFQNKISKKMAKDLLNKEINEYYTSIIIETFIEDNYLNDYQYAQYLIEKNQNNKGKKEIENILYKEKIASKIINELLLNFQENEEFVYNYINQKYQNNNTSNKMFIYKIKEQLLAKGFSNEIIMNAINNLNLNNDYESLTKDLIKYQKKYDNTQKVISKLINKGYNVEDIKSLIRKGDLNE